MIRTQILASVLVVLVAGAAQAQPLDLSWDTMDGGGQTYSTGGSYVLGSTTGQPDVGTMTGGTYTFTGGFWPGCTSAACGCLDPGVAPPAWVVVVDAQACVDGEPDGLSWDTAFDDLQGALDTAAVSGGTITEIWVAEGTYKPTARTDPVEPRSATFQLLNGVAVYGGFQCGASLREDRNPHAVANGTILSGDVAGDDTGAWDDPSRGENYYHVVTGSGTDATAVLDGFTITGGNANVMFTADGNGGGMYNYAGSPTVANCRFLANVARVRGAGMYNGGSSSPAVTDCVFELNLGMTVYGGPGGGGMYCDWGSKPVVVSCLFRENEVASGGGLMVAGSAEVTLIDCVFLENTVGVFGGAIAGTTGPKVHAIGCRFEGNRSSNGGAVSGTAGCTYVFIESEFIRNVAVGQGGGLYVTGGSTTLINCRFSDNSAQAYGGAVRGGSEKVDLVNCLFVGNRAEHPVYAQGWGGALSNHLGTMTATNCTFVDNVAQKSGGGIYHRVRNGNTQSSIIRNCVFWGNSDGDGTDESAQIFVETDSVQPPSATHTLIHGLILGGDFDGGGNVNNIGDDPEFAEAGNDNYRLQGISPCINAGSNAAVPPDTFDLNEDGNLLEPVPIDLDANPRIDGCVVDMGAYEFVGSPPVAIPADFDSDCDVDLDDYAFLEFCIANSGPDVALPLGCEPADLEPSNYVDLVDFTVLQRCFSGEDNPGDPNCGRSKE